MFISLHNLVRDILFLFLFSLGLTVPLTAALGAGSVTVHSSHSFGTVFTLPEHADIQYLASPQPAVPIRTIDALESDPDSTIVSQCKPSEGLAPVEWLPVTSIIWTDDTELPILSNYREKDDVWNDDFLEVLVLHKVGKVPLNLGEAFFAFVAKKGVRHIWLSGAIYYSDTLELRDNGCIERIEAPLFLKPGPYLATRSRRDSSEWNLHEVYRLYPDTYETFLFGAIPDRTSLQAGWLKTNLPVSSPFRWPIQLIPVPSRLYSLSNPQLPLAGKRFALKDIYDVAGLPTHAGSKAYGLVNPLPHTTASSITRLIALGAVLVGKTHTSQFAHGAAPWEFLDYPYSWNPRGDGHLTASASSSGSACAIAGYQWLDFTIGSDTRGSVRKPAALVGAYGIRPSWGSSEMDGVVPLSEELDTLGFFVRNVELMEYIGRLWYLNSPIHKIGPITRFPRKVYYPSDHFPMKNPAAQELVNAFLASLEQHLDVARVNIDMSKTLAPLFPNHSFAEFQRSSNKLAEYRSWNSIGQPTTQKHLVQFKMAPRFDPVPEKMFSRGRDISREEFEDAVKLKRSFAKALDEDLFKEDPLSCSDALFVYDAATGGMPSYRTEEFNSLDGAVPFLLTAPPSGVDHEPRLEDFFNFIASMGELPEVTVPIGQAKYLSPISKRWEVIPVALQLVAKKGCDLMLMKIVSVLGEMGVLESVGVGPQAF
ncbi:amidase signature domain-containing protein [Panaeolus papilionaceus]|nr:amidase signature domain-containing protein [Panaeolus papilionaceus]